MDFCVKICDVMTFESSFIQARAICNKTLGVENQSYANVSANLVSLLIRKGDFSKVGYLLVKAK
jgi:hypothetical protein